ncbi:oxygen-independent coproporphyrinogen-3 oxidase [Anaerosolibacter carboniphilus]|uniref:Oxygen-independent coproporphyrinogen-3 oxidase n=1 Tax=Anaerosolibacter carboniphilus TaxID=1417629 RepID=A0A841KV70_9FIRM|nr:coproporphyrinogen dehydrogenase HemZ [Anaerosolibacter carboniphilus]MBB6214832.1 oxygen-independent coproporphyrinogen-3 oxidase [Anaerosolibacter carboniphilus]
MKIYLDGHDYTYEIAELLKLFVDASEIEFVTEKALENDQSFLFVSKLSENKNTVIVENSLFYQKEKILTDVTSYEDKSLHTPNGRKKLKRMIKKSLFDVLCAHFKERPPWGILTGIRPSKIVHEMLDQSFPIEEIKLHLKNEYGVSEEKVDLVTEISLVERPVIENNKEQDVSIYIGIPFCPTRCLYCSFPSNTADKKHRGLFIQYMNALHYEIEKVGTLLEELDRKVISLYIGGGTPTVLSAGELDILFYKIKDHIRLEDLREITVEAGRPDTIDQEKLLILKKHGVDRISINPQTMNDATLARIGRSHTSEDIIRTYHMAKEIGFRTINMDLIVGLPDETPAMIEDTMNRIMNLNPENITVHTLAIKRASKLKEDIQKYKMTQEIQAKQMLNITQNYARRMGLTPYYMYRQKYMVGNLENIGYCKADHECIYNIQIMEERQTIIALGAGAISKVYYPMENRLERVPNVTNVEHYINRIEEMIEKKRIELLKFGNNLDR